MNFLVRLANLGRGYLAKLLGAILTSLLGGDSFACLLQLTKLNHHQTIASLLGLHQFKPVKVTQLLSLFIGSNLPGPSTFLPLFVDVGLLPRFLHDTCPCGVGKREHKLGQVQLLEVHRLSRHTRARSIDQRPVLIDDINNGDQFTGIWSIRNVCHATYLNKPCVRHF